VLFLPSLTSVRIDLVERDRRKKDDLRWKDSCIPQSVSSESSSPVVSSDPSTGLKPTWRLRCDVCGHTSFGVGTVPGTHPVDQIGCREFGDD
jgi:hypothetical protein